MSTGEKIAKLRKEHNYTQESLGEVIGVTRQAVSKWESDITFPETEKLILLSQLFNCSIDYLLNNNIEDKSVNDNGNNVRVIDKIFATIWSSSSFIITLLLFIFPYTMTKNNNTIYYPTDGYHNYILNVYDILFTVDYGLDNTLILLALVSQIIMFALGIVMLFIKKDVLYKCRYFCSIIECIIWVVICALEYYSFQIGMAFMILSSLGNVIGLSFIDLNKCINKKEEIKRSYNPSFKFFISILIFVLLFISYFLEAIELGPECDFLYSDHFSVLGIIYWNIQPLVLVILSIIGICFDVFVFVMAILILFKNKKIFHYFQLGGSVIGFGVWTALFIVVIVLGQQRILYAELSSFTLPILSLINVISILILMYNEKTN